jgi:hypothetical protein
VSQSSPEPAVGNVLQFVLDDRYTAGLFVSTVSADAGSAWQMPFLGWAVAVEIVGVNGVYTTAIVPVFLNEDDGHAVLQRDVELDRHGRLARLVGREPGRLP